MDSWDSIRTFLAVAEAASFTAGARRLAIDQSTASRHVSALEEQLGQRLFVRVGRSVQLTPAGATLRDAAEGVERSVATFERAASRSSVAVEGDVRLATLPEIEALVLAPNVPALLAKHPGLRLEIVSDVETVQLTRRDADLALRLTKPVASELVQSRVGVLRYHAYASSRIAAQPPDRRDWVGLDTRLAAMPESQWLSTHVAAERVRYRSRSTTSLAIACAAGFGAAVLPESLAHRYAELVRITPGGPPLFDRPLFLVMHRDLRQVPSVRAVADWLLAALPPSSGRVATDRHEKPRLPTRRNRTRTIG